MKHHLHLETSQGHANARSADVAGRHHRGQPRGREDWSEDMAANPPSKASSAIALCAIILFTIIERIEALRDNALGLSR